MKHLLSNTRIWVCCTLAVAAVFALLTPLKAQDILRRGNDPIPAQVDNMYLQGIRYLAKSQSSDGSWATGNGQDPGVVGLCLLAILAYGEDPNHGPYAENIRLSAQYLMANQNKENGYIGHSMYNHGFATLALAELYGMANIDGVEASLKHAVDLILTAQKNNPRGGWRYKPDSKDADSTVTGCQIVALYGARNAGIPVPDSAFEKGLKYMSTCRSISGTYGYTSHGGTKTTLTAIGSLCYSLAKQKDKRHYERSLSHLKENIQILDSHYPNYFRYYMSQALFHADEASWEEWNQRNARILAASQDTTGAWNSNRGSAYATATNLLSLALNYRFLPIYEK